MNAFPRSLADEARFTAPLFEDDDSANVETQAAVGRFWEVWGSIEATSTKLDNWAGQHDSRADCGEARESAAAEIDAITAKLQEIAAAMILVLAAAERVQA